MTSYIRWDNRKPCLKHNRWIAYILSEGRSSYLSNPRCGNALGSALICFLSSIWTRLSPVGFLLPNLHYLTRLLLWQLSFDVSGVIVCAHMRMRVCVNAYVWICAADNSVTQVCRSLSELPPVETRVHSAHAHTFRHAYILREGPRSLDGCHYTAYHQNVRMGMKAAAVEQVDSGCLSDNTRNSRLLTPPHISDTLLAEYCRTNAKQQTQRGLWELTLLQTTKCSMGN